MKKIVSNKKINKNLNGFSMMEVVISVFLISTGLIAAVELISSGLVTSMDSRDQLIATELTQEGLELVRNIRDNNWVNTDSLGSFDYIVTGDECRIDSSYDYGEGHDIECNLAWAGEGYGLFLDNTTNLYRHNSTDAIATKFYRKIKIADADGSDNRLITSMVSWNGSFPETDSECTTINKCTYAQTKLTTWGQP